jgi:hypothetical protein
MGKHEDMQRLFRKVEGFFQERRLPKMADGGELIIGIPGSGKSFLEIFKMMVGLERGSPFCYIDPKGETYWLILALFMTSFRDTWEKLKHRILFINPVSKCNHIVGFNAIGGLQEFDDYQPDLTALLSNSIVSLIRNQSGFDMFEADRMQAIMDTAIGTLVSNKLTLAELPLLFRPYYQGKNASTFNPVVTKLLENVDHFGTRSFWTNQWATWTQQARREWVSSTETRIFRYLFDERMLLTVCTNQGTLNFRQLVDEGYWLFVNLPYQLLSEQVTTVLGNLIITKIHQACMQRRPGERGYRLILDEARFFHAGPLDKILDTSRAFNLYVTLIVQSLNQMCRISSGGIDEHLRESVLNSTKYITVFQDDVYADVETLARMMYPITGTVPCGTYSGGSERYLPTEAEKNMNERQLMDLTKRHAVVYDKQKPGTVKYIHTPNVDIQLPDQGAINLFEAEHMKLTGVPAYEVKREIVERYRHWEAMLEPQKKSKPNIGGEL